jgi:hypothetical protein
VCSLESQLGLPAGAAVGVCLPNIPEWLLIDFSLVLHGAMSVGIHGAWGVDKIAFVVNDSKCKALFTDPVTGAALAAVSQSMPSLTHLVVLGEGDSVDAVRRACPPGSAGLRVVAFRTLVDHVGAGASAAAGRGRDSSPTLGESVSVTRLGKSTPPMVERAPAEVRHRCVRVCACVCACVCVGLGVPAALEHPLFDGRVEGALFTNSPPTAPPPSDPEAVPFALMYVLHAHVPAASGQMGSKWCWGGGGLVGVKLSLV